MTCYGGDYPFAAFGPEEHQFVARLMELGSVVWVGRQGWGRAEFTRPRDWQNLRRDGNEDRLATFEENRDCLCLNTGGEVVVVDVDTRNCGDIEKVSALLAELGVRIFAEVDTPGGGKHFFIAGHPDLPSVHSTEKNQRLPGYPGVDIQSFGCNVYLPGTDDRSMTGAATTSSTTSWTNWSFSTATTPGPGRWPIASPSYWRAPQRRRPVRHPTVPASGSGTRASRGTGRRRTSASGRTSTRR